MPDLATIMSLASCGFAVVEDQPIPTIECIHERCDTYSASDWNSLALYADKYALCGCPWH